jgi:hypothetical protein
MPVLKLGFALEGNSDYPIIPRLARRLIAEYDPAIVLANDPVLRPRKRGHGFIRELPNFAQQLGDDGVDIVVAIVDTDSTQVNERRRLLQEARQRCTAIGVGVCLADGLAVHALEAWLLADEAAVFAVFDGVRSAVTFPSPEQDLTPKATLNGIVRTLTQGQEVSFVPFAEEMVQHMRLKVLRQRCSHFDEFARNLINCVKEWERA